MRPSPAIWSSTPATSTSASSAASTRTETSWSSTAPTAPITWWSPAEAGLPLLADQYFLMADCRNGRRQHGHCRITTRIEEIYLPGYGAENPGWTKHILHIIITPNTAHNKEIPLSFQNSLYLPLAHTCQPDKLTNGTILPVKCPKIVGLPLRRQGLKF